MSGTSLAAGTVGGAAAAARIGPNAITRMADALRQQLGPAVAAEVFGAAGLAHHWLQPPQQMVDEADARRLHAVLRHELGAPMAAAVSTEAGTTTAEYLLAHRIPRPVQALLKRLPAALAARVLLSAISRHAWTFAGSGRFAYDLGAAGPRAVVLTITDNPLCRGQSSDEPVCQYYTAVFQRLFEVLVHRAAQVVETACEACGDSTCRFEIRW